jgi:hypothetical protein
MFYASAGYRVRVQEEFEKLEEDALPRGLRAYQHSQVL